MKPSEEKSSGGCAQSHRLNGRVKWLDSKNGFGFVAGDDGKNYFIHYTAIQTEGFLTLQEGEPVEFEAQAGPKGPAAINGTSLADRLPKSRSLFSIQHSIFSLSQKTVLFAATVWAGVFS